MLPLPAIYGARSGNGVVVITTKQGAPGDTKVNFNAYYGVQNLRNKINMADANLYRSHELAAGSTFPVLTDPTDMTNTDWQDQLFVNGYLSSQDLSGIGRIRQLYVLRFSKPTMTKRASCSIPGWSAFGIRSNITFTDGKFTLGNNLYVSSTDVDRMANFDASPLDVALQMPSTIPVYDPANVGGFGGPDGNDGDQVVNPIGIQTLNSNTNQRTRLVGNTYLEYDLLEGLTYRINAGYDVALGYSRFYNPFWESGDVPNVSSPGRISRRRQIVVAR